MNVTDAISAVRGKARKRGFNPERMSADSAIRVLDDWARASPRSQIGRWYGRASDRTITQFEKYWRRWQRGRVGEAIDRPRRYYWMVPYDGSRAFRRPGRFTSRRRAIHAARDEQADDPERWDKILVLPGDQDDPDYDAEPLYRVRGR